MNSTIPIFSVALGELRGNPRALHIVKQFLGNCDSRLLPSLVDQLEGVHAEAVHVAVVLRDAHIVQQKRELHAAKVLFNRAHSSHKHQTIERTSRKRTVSLAGMGFSAVRHAAAKRTGCDVLDSTFCTRDLSFISSELYARPSAWTCAA